MVDHKNLAISMRFTRRVAGWVAGGCCWIFIAMDPSLSNYEMLAMKPHEPCGFHAPVVSFRNWERNVWIDSIDDTDHETHRKRCLYIYISY